MQKNRRYTIAFLLILLLVFSLAGSVSAEFPDGWLCRVRVGLSSSFIGSALTAHPTGLTTRDLPWELISSNSPFPAQADGGDVRITMDSAGTILLPIDMSWDPRVDPSASETVIWTPVDRPSATDTAVYVWWNTSTTESQPDRAAVDSGSENVWDANYILVLHMEEASGTLIDATSNNNDFIVRGSPTFQSAGSFGYGILYNADTERHIRAFDTDFDNLGTITAEGSYKRIGAAGSSWGRIISFNEGTSSDFWAVTHSTTSHHFASRVELGASKVQYNTQDVDGLRLNIFDHVATRFDGGSSNLLESVKSGVVVASQATSSHPSQNLIGAAAATDTLSIGSHASSTTRNVNGIIDEIRFSDITRSDDWMAASSFNADSSTYAVDDTIVFRGAGVWWDQGTSTIFDTWIDGDVADTGTNYGTDTLMWAGDLGGSGFKSRPLILTTGLISNIGTDNNITACTLFIYQQSVSISDSLNLHELLRLNTAETEATWNNYKTTGGDSGWTTVGAESDGNDYDAAEMSTEGTGGSPIILKFPVDTSVANAALQGVDTMAVTIRDDGVDVLVFLTATEAGANQPGFKFVFEQIVTSKDFRHSTTDVGERHNPTSASLTKRHEP